MPTVNEELDRLVERYEEIFDQGPPMVLLFHGLPSRTAIRDRLRRALSEGVPINAEAEFPIPEDARS